MSTAAGAEKRAAVLQGQGIQLTRGGVRILGGAGGGIDVEAVAGEPLALTGPSGSGKSSLLAVLGGLLAPSAGQVRLDSDPIGADPAGRRRIGMVTQGYALVGLLTAGENVEVGLRAAGNHGDLAAMARNALARVDLADRDSHLIEDLSGGQQQRVAVARALAPGPAVLLADEPTAELDHDTRDAIMDLLIEWSWAGGILVVATHDPDIADRCDRTVHLVDGEVAADG